jgi:hypothetical protein
MQMREFDVGVTACAWAMEIERCGSRRMVAASALTTKTTTAERHQRVLHARVDFVSCVSHN